MKLKKVKEVPEEEVTAYGSTGTTIQWLWKKDDGVPRFALRRFKITPGGEIGLHGHPEEHEIFIMEGKALVFNDSGDEFNVEPQDVLYVPPDEIHGYKNTGDTDFVFLCIIPILPKE